MANDEDLARIRQGVAVWNAWRVQNPESLVNLSSRLLETWTSPWVKLFEANLDYADLRGAHFFEADLRYTSSGGRWRAPSTQAGYLRPVSLAIRCSNATRCSQLLPKS